MRDKCNPLSKQLTGKSTDTNYFDIGSEKEMTITDRDIKILKLFNAKDGWVRLIDIGIRQKVDKFDYCSIEKLVSRWYRLIERQKINVELRHAYYYRITNRGKKILAEWKTPSDNYEVIKDAA